MDGKPANREKILILFVVLLFLAGGTWRAVNHYSSPEPEIVLIDNVEGAQEQELEPEMITVHLVGKVNNPGVYILPEGSRVYELLAMGGGFTEGADREAVNKARPLLDGEQVHIFGEGEVVKSSSAGTPGLININRASASDLTALPGIGEVRAEQIVRYREEHGQFRNIEEIMDVSGIGQATFDNFAGLITVY